jgi:2'-5' RNA ligase
VTRAGSVGRDERIRLFVALELPDGVVAELERWRTEHLSGGRNVDGFHVTLAFLGSQPTGALAPVVDVLRREIAAAPPFLLEPHRYRETRSVAMLVLADPSGQATALAERIQRGLEALGIYERERRPWLPHVSVLRFREPPRLRPPLPEVGPFAPSGAAALLSRLHRTGARYEVLESCALSADMESRGSEG